MAKVQNGDRVIINYTGKLADGSVFDTTEGRAPFGFVVGGGQVFLGFSQALVGMQAGEVKTVTIPADDAYGPYYDDLTREMERRLFPDGASLRTGQTYPMVHQDGTRVVVILKELTEETVTIDANHPMAGKDLTFKIELLEVGLGESGGDFGGDEK